MWAKFKNWLIRKLVICCKDCAECWEKDMFGVSVHLECRNSGGTVKPDGYCAWAVRRDNNG